jgi:hypothetical protein
MAMAMEVWGAMGLLSLSALLRWYTRCPQAGGRAGREGGGGWKGKRKAQKDKDEDKDDFS